MALWGSRDSFSITGTVDFVEDSATVTGSGTAFTTELEVGDAIITTAGEKFKVTGIANNTSLTIDPAWPDTDASGETVTGQDVPKYLAARDRSVHGIDRVFGVDQTEALVNGQDPGWVRVIQYTDVHGNLRDKRSVLVAMKSITGDAADDAVYPDAIITIVTQPEDSSANTGDAVDFTVVASIDPVGTTINYRWQEAANANVAFVNLTDAGVYSNTATPTLEIADNTGLDGYIYRVQLSADGVSANTVSANATIEEL
jgi:hypothetical protein